LRTELCAALLGARGFRPARGCLDEGGEGDGGRAGRPRRAVRRRPGWPTCRGWDGMEWMAWKASMPTSASMRWTSSLFSSLCNIYTRGENIRGSQHDLCRAYARRYLIVCFDFLNHAASCDEKEYRTFARLCLQNTESRESISICPYHTKRTILIPLSFNPTGDTASASKRCILTSLNSIQ
jgi:hypothetical protein